MSSWKILISPEATQDILGIYEYISKNLLVQSTAEGIVKKILETIQSLDNMPMRCSLYEKEPWKSKGLRKIGVGHFIIFYFADESAHEVVIYHVFYSGSDIDQILH